jgi:hypothetical protein
VKRPSSWLAALAAAAVGVSTISCGSSSSPGGSNFSAADQANLASALTNSGALNATGLAGFASFLTAGVTSVGSMNAATSAAVNAAVNSAIRSSLNGVAATSSYEGAVGFEVTYNISSSFTGGDPLVGYFVGALGWNGLSSTGVSNFAMAGGGDVGSTTLPSGVSGTIGADGSTAFGIYYDGTGSFGATSGNVTITPSGFSGSSVDCSATAQGVTVTCSVTGGSMSGNFNFDAQSLTSDATYTQPGVAFSSLPAVKISISL